MVGDAQSGSHTTFMSSSYEVKVASREDAATNNDVDGSYARCEYALGLGIDFIGKCPSS